LFIATKTIHCIKVIIKISKIYCNEIFYFKNLLLQILLQYLALTTAMSLISLQRFFSL